MQFADFITFLAPPPQLARTRRARDGEGLFIQVGCANCHLAVMATGPNAVAALNNVLFFPFSDFLLHDMGDLSDRNYRGRPGSDLAVLALSYLTPAPEGYEYRAWASHGGRWTLLGRVQLDNDLRSLIIAEGPKLVTPPDQLQVTLEPVGAHAGTSAAPTGQPVVRWPDPRPSGAAAPRTASRRLATSNGLARSW
jgi:Di-haem oxidoreductase, putative peroxidase